MYRLIFIILGAAGLAFAGDLDAELLSAARKGDLSSVKALLQQGAALEAQTPYGQTPLYLAAMNGHEEVVGFLLEKGANTAVKDSFYKAPMLGFVLQRKHFGVAKLLISKGKGNPDEDLPDVAETGNAGLVEALLAKGRLGQPVLDRTCEAALEKRQDAVAELLKKAGAQEPPPAVAVDPTILASYAGTYKSDQIPASPVAAAGKPYISSEDGDVYVVKAGAQYGLLSTNPVGEPLLATRALSGDLLIIRGARHLFAIAEK